ALGEYRHAIDHEFEAFAPPVLLAAQLHAAQTGFAIRTRQYLATGRDIDMELIQVRFAVADRPPALRVRDPERNRDGVATRFQFHIAFQRSRAAVGRAPTQCNLRRRRHIGVDIQSRVELCNIGRYRLLCDMEIGNAQSVPAFQLDVLPDSFGDDARTPVPAVLVRGLAHVVGGLLALG